MTRETFALEVMQRVATADEWQPYRSELMDVLEEHDISQATAYRVIDGLIIHDVLYENANGELEMSPEARQRIQQMHDCLK